MTSPLKILIAEDDPVSRQVIVTIMSRYGEVTATEDGAAAIAAFEAAWDAGAPFELVMLDIMRPHKNGHEVLEAIRAYEKRYALAESELAKVVIITVLGDEENFMRAHEAGSEWYLNKPLNRDKVLDLLVELGLQ